MFKITTTNTADELNCFYMSYVNDCIEEALHYISDQINEESLDKESVKFLLRLAGQLSHLTHFKEFIEGEYLVTGENKKDER